MKLKYIDALRGIAILLVITVHTFQVGESVYNKIISLIVAQGGRGVQLFFLASAFTLMLSFEHRLKRENNLNRNFYIRRFFRIAPLYYLGIIYFIFQNGLGYNYWLGDKEGITYINILSNIFFIHGFNPYWISSLVPGGWSIAVEMIFYFIFPYLFYLMKNVNIALSGFFISLLIMLVLNYFFLNNSLINSQRLWGEYLFFYFPNQLPVFFLGIIAYFIVIKKQLLHLSKLNIVLFAVVIIIHVFLTEMIANHIVISILFLLLLLLLSRYSIRFFVNKFTCFMGEISYSSYLVHFAVLHWFVYFDLVNFLEVNNIYDSLFNFGIRLIFVILVTAFLSKILLLCIEKPFQKYGKSLINYLQN